MNHTIYRQTCKTLRCSSGEYKRIPWEEFRESLLYQVVFLPETSGSDRGTLSYEITMENNNVEQIFLEQKEHTGSLIRKNYHRLTLSQCQRILSMDIGWMCLSGEPFFQSFYVHAKMYHLKPLLFTQVKRMVRYIPQTGITDSYESFLGISHTPALCFFSQNPSIANSLPQGTLRHVTKKEKILPVAVLDMLQNDTLSPLA